MSFEVGGGCGRECSKRCFEGVDLKAWHGELGGLFVAIGNLRQEEENP